MTSSVAVAAGTSALLAVLLLGSMAHRPLHRRPIGAGLPVAPEGRTRRGHVAKVLGGAFVVGVVVAALGPVPTAIVGAAGLAVRRRRRVAMIAAQRRAIDAAMPDAVELLVLCVHAGCSPTQAVVGVAARAPPAVRPLFADVELGLHRGCTLADALGVLAASSAPLGREVAAAVSAADRDGLPLAPVLDRLATEARAARRRSGEAAARQLPVRLTFPLVVCTLPAFVLLAIAPAVLGALSTLRSNVP